MSFCGVDGFGKSPCSYFYHRVDGRCHILYIIMHHIFLGIGALCGPCGNLCRRREKYIVLYCVLYFPKQLVQLRVLYISAKRVSGYPDPKSVGRDCRLPECRLPDCRLPKQLAQLILNEIYTYIYIIYIYIYIYIYIPRVAAAVKTATSVNQQGARDVSLRHEQQYRSCTQTEAWRLQKELGHCPKKV